jgi:acyl-CoA synthetase (AMP-forming)/AMP-acid ligase II
MIKHYPVSVRSEHTDFVDCLRYWSSERPQHTAFSFLVDGESHIETITYGELDRRARALAVELVESGLAGERALLLFPPGLDFVAALFGCFYAGVVVVPAFPPRRNRNMDRLQAISRDADARAALITADVVERVEPLLEDAPQLQSLKWIATDQVDLGRLGRWKAPRTAPESLAVLQYTSGSTGSPKGVMLSHANLIANCQAITWAFQTGDGDIGMSWLPAYHDMGLIGGILKPVYIGSPSVLMSPMVFLQKPVRWLRAISRHRVTVSGGPNFAYDLCAKKVRPEELTGLDLSCWTLAYNGAETVRPATVETFSGKFERCGFSYQAFYPCYGMAESTLMIAGGDRFTAPLRCTFDGDRLDQRTVVPVSDDHPAARSMIGCGRELPGERILIVDPDSRRALPPGRVGEIWVASKSVGLGYLNKPRETKATFRARLADDKSTPFLRTGDLGFFHQDQLFITGRLKDLIIVRGINRHPQDIEMTVEQSDERLRVGATAAFAVEQNGREQLIIVSEVERVRQENWEEVLKAIRRNVVATHELAPDGIVLIRAGSMPKTSSGKIQRHACRIGFSTNSLMAVASWFARDGACRATEQGDAAGNLPRRAGHSRDRLPPGSQVRGPEVTYRSPFDRRAKRAETGF